MEGEVAVVVMVREEVKGSTASIDPNNNSSSNNNNNINEGPARRRDHIAMVNVQVMSPVIRITL
jgi:hypothetical protein